VHEELDRLGGDCAHDWGQDCDCEDERDRPCPCDDDCLAGSGCSCACLCRYTDEEYRTCRACGISWRDQELAEEAVR
jgi:hypothetical protein